MFLSCFTDTKTPYQMKEACFLLLHALLMSMARLMVIKHQLSWPWACSPQTTGTWELMIWTPVIWPCYLIIKNQRILHELIIHPVTPFIHLDLKNSSLEPVGEFGCFLNISCLHSLFGTYDRCCSSLTPQPDVSRLAFLCLDEWIPGWLSIKSRVGDIYLFIIFV